MYRMIREQKGSKQLISGPDIPTMRLVHEDQRRAIREVEINTPGSPMRRVTEIVVNAALDGKSVDLGNHYHGRPEHFTIVAGDPVLTTAYVDNPEDVQVQKMHPGDTVTMDPRVAHKFNFPDGPGELRSTMEGTFEESETRPHQL